MNEPLDFPKIESLCWRELCRHQVSELELVMSATIIRLSFVIGEPFLHISHAIDLARLTGMSKGSAHGVVQRLVRSRALEVSADKRIYTFLPPSKAWPWLWAERVPAEVAAELEGALVWANADGQRRLDLFPRDGDRAFTEALAQERMRAKSHRAPPRGRHARTGLAEFSGNGSPTETRAARSGRER